MIAARSTIAFQEEIWPKIKWLKNRSKFVNEALKYFFAAKDYVKKAEQDFILWELAHFEKTWESYTFKETFN